MGTWHSDFRYFGRILELHRKSPHCQLRLLVEDRVVEVDSAQPFLSGLSTGDLIEFTLAEDALHAGQLQIRTLSRLGGPLPQRRWTEGDALRWRRPGKDPSRMALLKLRHNVLRAMRAYFDANSFLEVETPTLVRAPSPEPQFAPVAAGDDFLITSPEFQLKRLLVGGMDRLVRIGPAYRGGERGHLHNPEFTLLEWYRAHSGYDALAQDLLGLLVQLVPIADEFAKAHPIQWGATPTPRLSADWVHQPLPMRTVSDLFRHHLKMDLRGVTTVEQLIGAAREAGWPHLAELPYDFDGAFSRLWIDIEAQFPPDPFLVVDWPSPLASLARLKPENPTIAERIEMYAGGIELANGFSELTDAAVQRRRFESNLAQRKAQGLRPLPLDGSFLAALEDGMPPSAGMALGVDRLVMLVGGIADIRDVLTFAADEI